ncbi:GPH family glycoside/pentoside/hexuronide:cation symporter [Paenibacillus castaneae]|uniref:MFS transporter n=1 Tax=Paenibacillus castaneae TaxID=474957 RepID=UPI000C9C173E|nr:MFS transporter [Paenibacillus castaneae]NIK76263.1 GPH family glycoside/pentoside/hexuronide:cation symporter [Paenibacillus castaneae]
MSTASLKTKLAYSSGNLSVNLIAQAFASYIIFYYVDVLGVRPGLISAAMVIHGIVNAVLNPLFGHLSDRTKSRWGRRIPYMMFGMVPLAALFTAIWFPIGTGSALFWYFLTIVLLYDVLFVMVVLNYSALFPEMFTTMKERASVSSWRQMFGIVGMIIGVALPPLVYGKLGWGPMGAIFAGIALIFFIIMITSSKEKTVVAREQIGFLQSLKFTFSNKAFVMFVIGSFFVQFTFAVLPAAIPFFSKYVLLAEEDSNSILLGAIFIAAIPCVYLWGRLLQKWGPRKTVMAAVAVYAAAMLPFLFVSSVAAAAIAAAAIGIGLAGLLVLLDVLLSEIIDEDEKRTNVRREGMYFGMNGFIVRWGVSLQAVVLGIILETVGYVKDAVQSEAAVWGIRSMLSIIPFTALLIALLFFYLYPIRKFNRSQNQVTKHNDKSI